MTSPGGSHIISSRFSAAAAARTPPTWRCIDLSVRIRLARAGAKKKPFYRVVVADQRAPRDGRFIEIVGRYNPRTDPSLIELDIDRINDWIGKGAQPTETVTKLMAISQSPDAAAPETEKDKRISKKQQAKAAADSEADAAEDVAAAAEEVAEAAVEAAEELLEEAVEVAEDAAVAEAVAEAAEEVADEALTDGDVETAEAAEEIAEAAEEATEELVEESVALAEDAEAAAEIAEASEENAEAADDESAE